VRWLLGAYHHGAVAFDLLQWLCKMMHPKPLKKSTTRGHMKMTQDPEHLLTEIATYMEPLLEQARALDIETVLTMRTEENGQAIFHLSGCHGYEGSKAHEAMLLDALLAEVPWEERPDYLRRLADNYQREIDARA